jgi:hypothetical protein
VVPVFLYLHLHRVGEEHTSHGSGGRIPPEYVGAVVAGPVVQVVGRSRRILRRGRRRRVAREARRCARFRPVWKEERLVRARQMAQLNAQRRSLGDDGEFTALLPPSEERRLLTIPGKKSGITNAVLLRCYATSTHESVMLMDISRSLDQLIASTKEAGGAPTTKASCRSKVKIGKHRTPIMKGHPLWKKKDCRDGWFCRVKGCAFRHGCRESLGISNHRDDDVFSPMRCRYAVKTLSSENENESLAYDASHILRPETTNVVVDGLNLCFAVMNVSDSAPTFRLLTNAIEYFDTCGIRVWVVLPHYALKGYSGIKDVHLLTRYIERGVVNVCPSGMDDDLFLFRVAEYIPRSRIISNDHFKNHVRRGAIEKEWISRVRVPYMFVGGAFLPLGL